MALPISGYLIDDDYAPSVPKPSLQQYDNYQIYDIYSTDLYFERISEGTITETITKNTRKLAVQVYNVTPIPINFDSIVRVYT